MAHFYIIVYKKENNELVSATNQLKLTAADGKKYLTDTLDYYGIIELAKNFPSKQANRFVEWFAYSDETIDGKSKSKAYALLQFSLTGKINDREMFMKGIDYSYYYEQENEIIKDVMH